MSLVPTPPPFGNWGQAPRPPCLTAGCRRQNQRPLSLELAVFAVRQMSFVPTRPPFGNWGQAPRPPCLMAGCRRQNQRPLFGTCSLHSEADVFCSHPPALWELGASPQAPMPDGRLLEAEPAASLLELAVFAVRQMSFVPTRPPFGNWGQAPRPPCLTAGCRRQNQRPLSLELAVFTVSIWALLESARLDEG